MRSLRTGLALALVVSAVTLALAPSVAVAQRAAPGGAAAGAASRPRPLVKVSREEVERMAAIDIEAQVGKAGTKVLRGSRVAFVRAPSALELPSPIVRREVEVAPAPRRAGSVTTAATLVLFTEAGEAARVALTVGLVQAAEAAVYDVPKGSVVTLHLQRGLVEITAQAVTGADADVGDLVSVTVRPSGKALRGRVVAKDRVQITEEQR
ncbi:MAG: flagella basal body P-ring formation protein FlgA [Myxococcales bacterium]|nr:flagella basal body P-ring formation protein FlgA [Myxococcales bacterium]